MNLLNPLLVLGLTTIAFGNSVKPIYDHFGGAKAEISSYRTIQPRYGEPRAGHTVMVFVPEDFDKGTRVKIENYSKPHDKVTVLKLNRGIYFNTGVYNYSVMTSTFSSMSPLFGRLQFPLKISISVNEWCGNFYAHLLPNNAGAKYIMHSYFEAEGDQDRFLKKPSGEAYYEDNLPILIRELAGEMQKPGTSRTIHLLPSLWHSRITHKPLSWERANLSKSNIVKVKKGKETVNATHWIWETKDRKVEYWVQVEYPRYIIRWQDSTGGKGDWLATLHRPYWQDHQNSDLKLRKELGLP